MIAIIIRVIDHKRSSPPRRTAFQLACMTAAHITQAKTNTDTPKSPKDPTVHRWGRGVHTILYRCGACAACPPQAYKRLREALRKGQPMSALGQKPTLQPLW